MSNATSCRVWPAGCLLLAAAAFVPAAARAQAWLPDPGQGSFYVGYQYAQAHWTLMPLDVTGVVFPPYTGGPGNKIFEGEHYDQNVTADAEYAVRHGLAVTGHLGYVASRYDGARKHREATGQIVVDDGFYHPTFQDAEVGLHQVVLRAPFVATPFVAYRFPVDAYSTIGHAASGHHLRELRVGATLGRDLRPFLPDAYGVITYAYSAAEREDDHSIHRNGVDMELGYFVTRSLSLKGAASWVRTGGGIEWYRQSAEYLRYRFSHDALANERSWRVGGGAGYALTPRYQLYALGFATVWGANTHAMNTFATGIGWNFASPWAR
jgi:hypothetical protein